jgi:hypothetical protein
VRAWRAIVCCAIAAIAAADARPATSGCETFNLSVARRLIAAKNVQTLDAAMSKSDSVPLTALYRSRRLDLNPTAAEEQRFFEALPATRDQLLCVYHLTAPREVSETTAVSTTVYGMFDRAAAICRKTKSGYGRVLQLSLWADGELGEAAWDWYNDALDHDPHAMTRAIRGLPVADQRRLCGRSTRGISERDLLTLCRQED